MGNADVLAKYLDFTIDVNFADAPTDFSQVLEAWRERISPCYILSLK